ncbi:MAG: hypothetical protein RLZZ303_2479 [Candidatus Hydrogenedentota bacterium]|jgi:orotidine-5'-phosphate decarboxylase
MLDLNRETDLVVVLDVDTLDEALAIVDACGGCDWFKAGSQLFTRTGPECVAALKARGKRVFLDLKFHDIPNTVAHAARAAADLGADLITLHALGGSRMINAAREAVEGSQTRILAVTILTSHSEAALREDLGLHETSLAAVGRLARLAVGAGAHGVVCSPREIVPVREILGQDALVVTPGIRPAWASKDDQERVMTPAEARAAGADLIVVGRPILKHENPAEAVASIREELRG